MVVGTNKLSTSIWPKWDKCGAARTLIDPVFLSVF